MNRTHPPWAARPAPWAGPGRRPSQPPGPRPRPAGRSGHAGFAGRLIQDIAAAAMVAAGQTWAAPTATTPRPRTITAPRPPHTVQLCIHCLNNPAGLWVSRARGTPARRPWCLSCCQELDPARYHLIPFDGQDARGCR